MDTVPATIGFDLDGVIIDHTANKLYLAERYGVHLSPEETHAEHMGKRFPPDVFAEIRNALYNETPEALAAPLVEGAFHGLSRLRNAGIPFALISLRQNPLAAEHLLERRGLWGNLFVPENVYFVRGAREKYEVAASLGLTHFVDDEPNILEIMPTIPHRVLFDLHDQFSDRNEFLRARHWEELVNILAPGA